ncbi:Mucin-associated surface protein (MASP), subgroup S030 [Trypanosoma cruzi]|uniref:Mucin-associated surface protein (MASP) subgroup S030 n=1 Tax=Trypanosoma cruzi TaxID=5693 RepID=A0A7J6XL08_TRYCR|nr:Mucin-associated surface protein (MASP) subgroup S030 [Trypanosoma cruzi]KAF8303822.1 Mucin-associated surface protein (MASP), subgroup S030 [Trypanosoma cruzi]
MAMMMTGRVLLVCALCVLWCGAGGSCNEEKADEFCNNTYFGVLTLLANKSDEELKEKYCKNEDDKAKCVNKLKNNIADALENEKKNKDNGADREPNVAHGAGVSVGSSKTKSSTAAGADNAGMSSPLPLSLKVEGDVDDKVHSPAGGAGHQPHFDDGRRETERSHHSEAEGSNQHGVGVQGKKIHNKDEEKPQAGLKSTEAREGTDGAPAPSQDPPNTAESHEDKSRRVAAPDTTPALNTSPGSNREQTSQSPSPSGSETSGSSDNEVPEKNSINTQMSGAPLKDEEQHRESTAGNKDSTTVESAAVQSNTTTPGDSDSSTAVTHTTSPLLLLLLVACAAAAAVVAA